MRPSRAQQGRGRSTARAGGGRLWRCLALTGLCPVLCLADACVRLAFTVTPEAGWFGPTANLDVLAAGGPRLRLAIRARGFHAQVPGENRSLRLGHRLRPGPHELRLRVRDSEALVIVDGRRLGTVPCGHLPGAVRAVFEPGKGILPDGRPRVQKLGPLAFADDFARGSDAALLWDIEAGHFALNSSLNPGSSQGAFQLWATAPAGRSVALAGPSRWYWDDLEAAVSGMVPELPAAWGLVLHWTDAETYHAVVWEQPAQGQGTIRLVRRRDGADTILAAAGLPMVRQQWYRLTAVTQGGKARVFVSGSPLLEAEDACLSGGRLGLLAESASNVYFDDVAVVSAAADAAAPGWSPAAPLGPGEESWSDFSEKRFAGDPFMMAWAHPRSLWSPQEDSGLCWFRGRMFHDVTLRWTRAPGQRLGWPAKPIRCLVFAEAGEDPPARGYGITVGAGYVALAREGREVTRGEGVAEAPDALEVVVRAGCVEVTVNQRRALAWEDPVPLSKGDVGVDFGRSPATAARDADWRDTLTLESTHRLDYGFDHAPAAWHAAAGTWQATHRWACVPKWSFFGGRGDPGPPECPHGMALLWNLRRVSGDLDIEVFAAPMEGTPQRVHFAWPVTLNVAFLADGENLDSGYSLRFGAYDVPTQLFREGRCVAQYDGRVTPGLRRQWNPWYNRLTRVWQHLRIQRRDGRILVDAGRHDDQGNYGGLERLLEAPVDETLSGDRFGLWTWGPNGLAIARATVSFEHSPGVAPVSRPLPAVQDLGPDPAAPQLARRVRNPSPGGFFSYPLTAGPVDLDRTGSVRFAARFPAHSVLSLVGRVRGQTAEAVLTGPEVRRDTMISLGRARREPSPSHPGWDVIEVDFRTPLRRLFPEGPLVIEAVAITSPCDAIEQIAGFGLNRKGDAYDVADLTWNPSPTTPAAPASSLVPRVAGHRPLDDFEGDMGGWKRLGGRDGAALCRDPHAPALGGYALRLLNQVVAGPAGACRDHEPYPLAAFPILCFAYRLPPDAEVNLLVKAKDDWYEIAFTGVDHTWPLIASIPDVRADHAWHSARIDLQKALAGRVDDPSATI
ncbi:MAG: hypothetical protein JXR77_13875, partial [Lentisphaeria bacterium]|nr:hypothetical protein [Lentisphaeria bacterium]